MTTDLRNSISVAETRLVATAETTLAFHVLIDNPSQGTRVFAATAIGLKNSRVVAEPSVLVLAPESNGQIVLEVTPATDQASFPTGRFLVGIEVTESTPTGPEVSLLSTEVEVQSVEDVAIRLSKPHLKAWTRSRTTLQLRNEGHQSLALKLSGSNPDGQIDFAFSRKGVALGNGNTIEIPPMASRAVTVRLKVPPLMVGRPVGRAYEVAARGPGGAVATTGTFAQRAIFAPVLFKALVAIAVIVVGMFVAQAVVQFFIVDPATFEWVQTPDTEVDGGALLPGRVGHSAVWLQYPRPPDAGFVGRQWRTFTNWFLGRDQEIEGMLVWGGRDGTEFLNDGALLRAEDTTWIGLTSENNVAHTPAPRTDHTAVWTGETMVIWGGLIQGQGAAGDRGAEYNPTTELWATLPGGGPSPRVGHTMTWTGEALYVIGGVDAAGVVHRDVWVLTPGKLDPKAHPNAQPGDRERALEGGSWSRLPELPGPTGARYHHSATWTGSYLVVFGGFSPAGDPLADAYALQPIPDARWVDITLTPAPTARACHAGLWTGSEILYLGGTQAQGPELASDEDTTFGLDPRAQDRASWSCRGVAAAELAEFASGEASELNPEALVVDPEALLLTPPPTDTEEGGKFEWSPPDEPAPQHLGSDFQALWTANEATVIQAVPQLDTLAAVRYSPAKGSASLPLPNPGTIGPLRGFTTVWINGGIIAWGGVEPQSTTHPGITVFTFSNDGAVLVLPDR